MSDVIRLKYMLEITVYPNGQSFQKIFPIGVTKIDRKEHNNKQKEVAQKKLDEIKQQYTVKVEGEREI